MLNLASKYWDWRKRTTIKTKFKTDRGFTVVQFANKFAVKASMPGKYIDLETHGHSWNTESCYFKDCLKDKDFIEINFGKILDLPENNA